MPVFGNYSCDLYFWRLLNGIKRQRRPCKHWGKVMLILLGKHLWWFTFWKLKHYQCFIPRLLSKKKLGSITQSVSSKYLGSYWSWIIQKRLKIVLWERVRGFLHPLTLAQRHGRSPSKYLTWCLDPIRLFQRDTCMMLKDQDKSFFVRDLNKQLCTEKNRKWKHS